jgi:acetoin utilization deacetylase AcuC-like enzyme
VEKVSQMTAAIPDHPNAIAHLDADTAVSRWSFEGALRAAGSLCQAVDRVVAGECRNAFCAVRPPGHHAGPRGIVRCANDVDGGSHGFCLLNNVAIGAAYARSMYRNEGIRKVAIVDFDVHHGNGTEAIIRNLVPSVEKGTIHTPFAFGDLSTTCYRPWLDETDIKNVFFASTHGYGNRGYDQPGWFYPASGKTHTSEAISHPAMVEDPNLGDFILSQTWTRMGEESVLNCCKIINVGLALPEPDADPHARSMRQRLELRDTYRNTILPNLRDFDPDIIFISAGFDAHRRDTMNFGYVGMVEDDYEWITEQLIKIANTCCNGRVVSVLEGGYKMHGGIVSPFARSAASHLRALVDGGRSRDLYDPQDCATEGEFEKNMYERRERKREQERDHLRQLEEAHSSNVVQNGRRNILEAWSTDSGIPEDPDAPCDTGVTSSRKRRRNQVNYKELFKQMQQEGFAG